MTDRQTGVVLGIIATDKSFRIVFLKQPNSIRVKLDLCETNAVYVGS